jgi:hypothetical protein
MPVIEWVSYLYLAVFLNLKRTSSRATAGEVIVVALETYGLVGELFSRGKSRSAIP